MNSYIYNIHKTENARLYRKNKCKRSTLHELAFLQNWPTYFMVFPTMLCVVNSTWMTSTAVPVQFSFKGEFVYFLALG